jgi:hypothetical protein
MHAGAQLSRFTQRVEEFLSPRPSLSSVGQLGNRFA